MSPYITKHGENKYVQEDMRGYPLIHNFIPPLKEFGVLPELTWQVIVKTGGNESPYLL